MPEVSIVGQGRQLKEQEDIQDVIDMLENTPDVDTLTLKGNSLAPPAGKALAKAIVKFNLSNIQVLNFSDLFTGRVRAEIPPTLTYRICFISIIYLYKLYMRPYWFIFTGNWLR